MLLRSALALGFLNTLFDDRRLLQAGAWMDAYFRVHGAETIGEDLPPAAVPDPVSDIPTPDWPFAGDSGATRSALARFRTAGLLEPVSGHSRSLPRASIGSAGDSVRYRLTDLGRRVIPQFPYYYDIEREALVDRFPRLADAVRGRRVLDAGCGVGAHSILLHRLGAACVIGLDFGFRNVETARSIAAQLATPLQWICGSIEELPLADDSIDFLFCRGVIPLTNRFRTIPEFSRVLAPGGSGLFMLHSPRYYFWRLRHLGLRNGRPRSVLAGVLGLGGGLAYDAFGIEPRWRGRSGPFCLSYQREDSFRDLLADHGLQLVHWETNRTKPYAWVQKV